MNRPMIAAYMLIPTIYDAVIGPLLRAVAFTSDSTEPSTGV
jgi:hypothetical protein